MAAINRWRSYFLQYEQQWIELCDIDPLEGWNHVVEKEVVLQDVLADAIEALLAGSEAVFDALLGRSIVVLNRCESDDLIDLLRSAPSRRLGIYLRAREYTRGLAGAVPEFSLLAESAQIFNDASLPPLGDSWGEVHEGWLLECLRLSALFDTSRFSTYRSSRPGRFEYDHGEAALLQFFSTQEPGFDARVSTWISELRDPTFSTWNQRLAWFEWSVLAFGTARDSTTWKSALRKMGN